MDHELLPPPLDSPAPSGAPVVTMDAEVMGGLPCFAGTRVPIENVLGSLDSKIPWEQVTAAHPFVTEDLVEAAREFVRQHPEHFPKLPSTEGASYAEIAPPRPHLQRLREQLHERKAPKG